MTEAGGRRTLVVLVADDSAVNARLAQALLQRSGHKADIATNGLEAVDAATAGDYDLILLDVHMPGIDGIEAARRIRSTLGDRCPPIFALTGSAEPDDVEQCLAAGMSGVLEKPVSIDALDATLADVLDHR